MVGIFFSLITEKRRTQGSRENIILVEKIKILLELKKLIR